MFWTREHKEQFENMRTQIERLHENNEGIKTELETTKEQLIKCNSTLNGIIRGSLNEKFVSFKKQAETTIAMEVGKVVEEKLVGIMSMILTNKEIDKITKNEKETKETRETKEIKDTKEKEAKEIKAVLAVDIQKHTERLEKEIKDLKISRNKDNEIISNRLSKLEANQENMNKLLTQLIEGLKKYDDEIKIE